MQTLPPIESKSLTEFANREGINGSVLIINHNYYIDQPGVERYWIGFTCIEAEKFILQKAPEIESNIEIPLRRINEQEVIAKQGLLILELTARVKEMKEALYKLKGLIDMQTQIKILGHKKSLAEQLQSTYQYREIVAILAKEKEKE